MILRAVANTLRPCTSGKGQVETAAEESVGAGDDAEAAAGAATKVEDKAGADADDAACFNGNLDVRTRSIE